MERQKMNCYLVAENAWGPIDYEEAKKHSVFECGMCSTESYVVFHNVLGRHIHLDFVPHLKKVVDEYAAKHSLNGE
jgi:hypothetical protein